MIQFGVGSVCRGRSINRRERLVVGLDNPIHLVFLLVIVLLVFGAKRLPEMGRSLGSGLRGFKESINGEAPAESHLALSSANAEPEGLEGQPSAETQPAA